MSTDDVTESELYKTLEAELIAVKEELILVKAERNKLKLELSRMAIETIKEPESEDSPLK